MLSFGSPSLFDTSPTNTNAAVAIGDVYGNGMQDLVTAPTSGGLNIAQGNGNGTFQPALPINASSSTPLPAFSSVQVADLDNNGNGLDDIVAADPKDNEVWVFMNQTIGASESFTASSYPTGLTPIDVAVADLTGNGLDDIVTANENGNSVSVLLSVSITIPGWSSPDFYFLPHQDYSVGTQPMAVAIGNFFGNDNTTPLDLVTANYGGNSISLLQGNGDGKGDGNGNGTFMPRLDIPITVTPPSGQSTRCHTRRLWPLLTSTAMVRTISSRLMMVCRVSPSCSVTSTEVTDSRPSCPL